MLRPLVCPLDSGAALSQTSGEGVKGFEVFPVMSWLMSDEAIGDVQVKATRIRKQVLIRARWTPRSVWCIQGASSSLSRAADPSQVEMAHVKRFQGIPMSKTMRSLCKEEDYAFLGASEQTTVAMGGEGAGASTADDHGGDQKEERVKWRREREQQEKEKLREIEESKKEKEQQWRTHVAEVASSQEKVLQDRLARLKNFREFQRKVLAEESGTEAEENNTAVNQLLTRI
ncbi:uncharacterized protein V6R79_001939 [Siganus canaliculatus]